MYPVTSLHILDGTITLVQSQRGIEPIVFLDMEQVDVMQWTGRVDAKGREIYEGDIVEMGSLGRTIIFWSTDGDAWMTQLRVENPELGAFFSNIIEVVGNIWETPDLLASDE